MGLFNKKPVHDPNVKVRSLVPKVKPVSGFVPRSDRTTGTRPVLASAEYPEPEGWSFSRFPETHSCQYCKFEMTYKTVVKDGRWGWCPACRKLIFKASVKPGYYDPDGKMKVDRWRKLRNKEPLTPAERSGINRDMKSGNQEFTEVEWPPPGLKEPSKEKRG